MKKEIISFTIKTPKFRAHKALFDTSLPFQPKKQQLKNQYRRKPKHKNLDFPE